MQYPKTKMLNILFARELASRLPANSPLIVNCLTPGLCRTGLRHEFPWPLSWIYVVVDSMIAWSAERGSRQLVFAALGREKREDELKGAYISSSEITEPSDFIISDEGKAAQKKAWVSTSELLRWLPLPLTIFSKSRTKLWKPCTRFRRNSSPSSSLWVFNPYLTFASSLVFCLFAAYC